MLALPVHFLTGDISNVITKNRSAHSPVSWVMVSTGLAPSSPVNPLHTRVDRGSMQNINRVGLTQACIVATVKN